MLRRSRRPRRALPAEARAQLACLTTRQLDLARLRVLHDEAVAAAEPARDLLHLLEVHQARLVRAEEDLRIEPLLELAQGEVGHQRAPVDVRVDEARLDR